MKKSYTLCLIIFLIFLSGSRYGQINCFLEDFEPKNAEIPTYVDVDKPDETPNLTVVIDGADTLGKISKYILGNAVATWVSPDVNNPTLMEYLEQLSLPLIRYPGGSWSDIFFFNKNPGDLPDSIYDGTTYNYSTGKANKTLFYPQYGPNVKPTPASYYNMCDQLGAQGLITINYGYARYGRSSKPVEQAAHLAADWVRYDDGRTKFWEIGNENDGPWEAGWMIDTLKNLDGQPLIMTGELYGKHFKIFADSMRAAAAEIGATIFIGAQIVHEERSNYWNVPDRKWNEGMLKEIGSPDSVGADFYVFHNYLGGSATSIKAQVDNARNAINSNINFIRQDLTNKNALVKPVALTEWNCGGPDLAKTSVANGMQAITIFCEMMKNNFGMSARWLIANWESDGMFYHGNNSGIPAWNPRPDFYYIYYLQRFTGDHFLNSSITGSYKDILTYATKFYSGHTGVVLVNKGTSDQVVNLIPKDFGVGDRYYVYTLTGVDNSQFPQGLFVNNEGPTGAAWGPLDGLENIPANAYQIGEEIKINSPAYSVEYVLIEPGSHFVSVNDENQSNIAAHFKLEQNYPNPFNPQTTISYSLARSSFVTLKIYDMLSCEVETLIQNKRQAPGKYEVVFNASNISSGIYFYKISTGEFIETKKMLLLK